MGKADFLSELRRALSSRLPEEELSDALAYYEEYFAEAGEDREEAVLQELGSPAAVAAKVLEDRGDAPPVPKKSPSRPKELVLWGVGILMACGVLAAVLLALLPLGPEEGAPLYGVIAGSEGHSDELLDFDSIHRLEIDLPAAEVLIAPETEGTGLYVEHWGDPNPNLYYDVENGTLRLWTEEWEEEDAEPSGGTVYLYLPQRLVWADINLDRGSLSVHGLEVQDLDVTIGQGDAALERLATGTLDAEVGTGALYLDNVRGGTLKGAVTRLGDQGGLEEHTPESLAEGDGTALVLEQCRAGVLELRCQAGDVAASGTFPGTVSLEAPQGSVYFSTTLARMDYQISRSGGSELLVYQDVEGGGSNYSGGDRWDLQVQAKTAAYLHFAA